MAVTNLANIWTLGAIKANVRSQTDTLSPQESQLFELQLNDIVHNSILFVRTTFGKLLDDFYSTTTVPTEASNLIDISSTGIQDVNNITLFDAGYATSGYSGVIPLVSNNKFYTKQTLFSATDLADTVLATISNIGGASGKLQIRTYRGTNKTPPGALALMYTRVPIKTTVDATLVDIPDSYVPVVIDVATVYVRQKFNQPVDSELKTRLQAILGSESNQLGLDVQPKA